MSRRTKLVLGLITLQASALVVVLGITYWASQDLLLRFSENIAARISRDATAYTEGYLDPADKTAELTQRLLETGLLDPGDRSALSQYFLELLAARPNFDGIYLGEVDGGFIYASRAGDEDPGAFRVKRIANAPARTVRLDWYAPQLQHVWREMDPKDDYDPRTRPWYEAALDEDGTVWTPPYIFFSSQAPGITVAVPVRASAGGGSGFVGAVGVDIKIAALSGFLETLDISPRGQAAIVAENGDIIAHSISELTEGGAFKTLAERDDPILTQAAAQIEGGLDTLFPGEIRLARFGADGETWIGAVLRLDLERTPWTVFTYLPEDDILGPLQRVRNIALVVSLLALISTAGLGALYARRVTG
ncbi:Methyl-accepting chemotaxis protein [Candidatus Rhodobacter oscarellae]|uniref:Methyl-accepting chemotaxis protein n=1 Tax=Candidatus Rhodobacter oscarellae TaxID=1675527 RepID=A0A0J9E657_9RHOB|nr:cache domain-containing protein [Candidatus Rhodobacter lobularis]KMW58126.1 Methyl-accepting chemotaxis protein [Candidatus Rhodobacter lobularis]